MLLSDRRKLELFLVAIILATLGFIAFERYAVLAKEARILQFKVISEHFITAAVYLRIEFLVSKSAATQTINERGVMVDGKLVYVSEQGWPASTVSFVDESFKPTDADCYELWRVLLQTPASIEIGQFSNTRTEYRTFAYGKSCRYSLVNEDFYFDYSPLTGARVFGPAINE